ncbi:MULTISPECIES: hypothetical protein [Ruegeria]|uniref:hypothetical protein n=1 Tax=Ruegeria TaxID=97050 RepID=UPI00147AA3E2|nr:MULTISPECIES: hypothetical protein [Ruegeria]MBO9412937.1 hypothetical protein [Ruegeria sp. R8_1]MBO9416516.1 hypothetical protein [Ruegeria sp. R8_2]
MKQVMTYAALAAVVLTTPLSAAGFARFGFQTVSVNANVYEVIPRGRNDVDGYWCAAADYARRTLGAGWKQPIYVVRGYGPSEATGRRTAVQFSVSPPPGVDLNVKSINVGFVAGQSRSVQSANALCYRRQIFDD